MESKPGRQRRGEERRTKEKRGKIAVQCLHTWVEDTSVISSGCGDRIEESTNRVLVRKVATSNRKPDYGGLNNV